MRENSAVPVGRIFFMGRFFIPAMNCWGTGDRPYGTRGFSLDFFHYPEEES
jgi:hypothetical protein